MAHKYDVPAQASAIRTELRTGLTFAQIALDSKYAGKVARNTAYAQKAYDNVRAWTERVQLSPADAKEIADRLEQLKAKLAKLRSAPPAHS